MRNTFQMTVGACTLMALGLLLDACADPTADPEQEPASAPAPATSAPVATALNPSEAEVKEALALAKRVFEAADPKAAYSALGEADRLKVDGVTLPHTLEIHDSEPEPSDVQNPRQTWTRVWQSDISADYLQTHGQKWVSQGYPQGNGTNMARAVFSCAGGGSANLRIWNLGTQQQEGKHHKCEGKRYHTPPVAYRSGESLKIILEGKDTTKVEAWAGR